MKRRIPTFEERESALALLPDIELLEQCRAITERAIGEAGTIVVSAIVQASAEQLTGPLSRGREKATGYVRHGTQAGSVHVGVSRLRIERARVRSRDGKEAK